MPFKMFRAERSIPIHYFHVDYCYHVKNEYVFVRVFCEINAKNSTH